MFERVLFLSVAIALASIAIYLGFSYIGLGLLMGTMLPFWWMLQGKFLYPAIETGGIIMLLGVACYVGAKYVAVKHGLTLEALTSSGFPRYVRRLPSYAVTALSCGTVLIVVGVLAKIDER